MVPILGPCYLGGRWMLRLTPASCPSRLQEKTDQLLSLEREATGLREAVEQQKTKNNVRE